MSRAENLFQRYWLASVVLVAIVGWLFTERFEMKTNPNEGFGTAWVLDRWTGSVTRCSPANCRQIPR
jgi:hypothetical protein